MKFLPVALGALVAFALGSAPAAPSEGAADAAARKLLTDKCGSCHALDRALKKSKDRDGWLKTVQRMRAYAPDTMSDEDVRLLVDYLSRLRGPRP